MDPLGGKVHAQAEPDEAVRPRCPLCELPRHGPRRKPGASAGDIALNTDEEVLVLQHRLSDLLRTARKRF